MPHTSDAALLEAVVNGDETAWQALVDRHAGVVWAVARSHGFPTAAAADISQTTWLRLAEHCDRITDPANLRSWLALTAQREAQRYFAVSGSITMEHDGDDPLLQALVLLDDPCPQLVRLMATELDLEDIAQMVGLDPEALDAAHAKCLELVESQLEETGISQTDDLS